MFPLVAPLKPCPALTKTLGGNCWRLHSGNTLCMFPHLWWRARRTWWCRRPWAHRRRRGSRSGWRPWSAPVPPCPKSATWSSGRSLRLSSCRTPRRLCGGSPPWLRRRKKNVRVVLRNLLLSSLCICAVGLFHSIRIRHIKSYLVVLSFLLF